MKRMLFAVVLFFLASSVHAQAPFVVTTTSCPTLYIGVPYQCQFQATGGVPPYHWRVQWLEGALPGLSMSDSGLLSGTVVLCSDSQPTNCLQEAPSNLKLTIDGVPIQVKPAPEKPVKKKKSPIKTT